MRGKSFLLVLAIVSAMGMAGCSSVSSSGSNPTLPSQKETTQESTTPNETTTDESVSDVPTTEVSTTEAPVTSAPTSEEETTKSEYVGAWTLMTQAKLNPKKSGYEELDKQLDELMPQIITDDMNGYKKAWACYEYLVDNITYSRGMDANTGMYSQSDPATTPKEVLWATDLFNTGQGCCYHYSSAYVYMLRYLGFDAHLVSGNVPAYNGGRTPHCWLYVNMDNGIQYIFDPDLDMNYYTREKNQGVENPPKDRFFCVQMDKMSYFYTIETYHTN